MKHIKKILSKTGEPMLSTRVAATRLSCAPDYIAKLCREGKLEGTQVKGAWFVDEASLKAFSATRAAAKIERSQELSALRRAQLRDAGFVPRATWRHVLAAAALSMLLGASVFAAQRVVPMLSAQGSVEQSAAIAQVHSPFFGTGEQISFGDFGNAMQSFVATLFGSHGTQPQTPVVTTQTTAQPVIATTNTPTTSTAPATTVNNTYPVRERVVERVVTQSGVTQAMLQDSLQQLANSLRTELYGSINGLSSVLPAQGGVGGAIAISQNISKLSGVSISNSTLTNSTIEGYVTTGGYTAGDLLYANASGQLVSLGIGSAGQILKVQGGLPSWGANSGGGGAGAWATTTDGLAVYPVDPTQVVLIGASATTTVGNIFEVAGNSLLRGSVTAYGTLTAPRFVATSSVASVLPFASTTALSVAGTVYADTASTTNLTVSSLGGSAGSCLTVNSSGTVTTTSCGSGGSFAFTPTTNFGATANATSTPLWFQNGLQASSTSQIAYASTTALSVSGIAYFNTASTSNLTVSLLPGTLLSTNGSGVAQNTTVSAPLSFSGSTLSIAQSGASTDGYLSSTDWNLFNNKISSSSLSATYPLAFNSSTGVFSTAFGTTTQNNFNAHNTFSSLFATDASTTNATTSTFAITSLGNTLLKTLPSGAVVAAVAGTDYQAAGNYANFGYLFPSNATTTSLAFNGGLTATGATLASTTLTGNFVFADATGTNATTTNSFATTASSTNLFATTGKFGSITGAGLTTCNTSTQKLLWNGGVFSCGTDQNTGGGGGSDVNWTFFNGSGIYVSTSSNQVVIGATATTSLSQLEVYGGALIDNATTTSLAITNISSSLLKTLSSGAVVAAVAGTDYLTAANLTAAFPFTPTTNFGSAANSTSTPIWFRAGLQASSTAQLADISTIGLLNFATTSANATSTLIRIGGSAFLSASTTGSNTGLGLNALSLVTGGFLNTAVGSNALQKNTSGSSNVALGNIALQNNTTGANNVAVGPSALQTNTTGSKNTAVGDSALVNLDGAVDNVAIGYQSSLNTTVSTQSVAIGSGASKGGGAGFDTTGYVAIGYQAGFNVINGSDYNTLIGYQAGKGITSGGSNIIVGSNLNANNNLTTGRGNIGLGNNVLFPSATANNQLNLGNLVFGTLPATSSAFQLPTSGSLGVGSSSPYAKLSVQSNNGDTATTLFAIGSSTATATSTLFVVSNTGSTTLFQIPSSILKTDGNGTIVAAVAGTDYATPAQISSASYGFFSTNNYGAVTQATTSTIWFQNGLQASSTSHFVTADFSGIITSTATSANVLPYASSTALSVSGIGYFVTASTTNLTVSALPGTLLSTNASGVAQSTSVSAPLSFSGSTLSITQATDGTNGYLSNTDWSLFNQKVSSSSLATSIANAFPFTSTTNYGATANSTSTPIWFTNGLQASSTSQFVYASTTALTVSGNFYGANLTACAGSSDKLLWTGGTFSCGNDAGATGFTETNWAFFNGSGVRLGTTSNQVLIGATATSSALVPLAHLNVLGGFGVDNATTTTLFATYASTTNLYASQLAIASSSASAGTTLAVAGGNIVQSASIPLLAAATTTASKTYQTVVAGRYAYVADYAGGLRIMDVSNPKSPKTVGAYTGLSTVLSVAVAGKYAYVGDTTTGFDILDVSNPAVPTLVGSYPGIAAFSLALSGKYAYVADYNGGAIRIIDVSDPRNPALAGSYVISSGAPYAVTVSGKYAYIGDQGNSAVYVVDISNPAAPSLVGTYSGPAAPTSVYLSGRYLYVTDLSGGLYILNVGNPASPSLAKHYTGTTNSFYGVSVAGNYAYVADRSGSSLLVLDVSDPANAFLVGTTTTGSALGLSVSGKYAYVSSDSDGLKIVDLNGVEAPTAHIGSIESSQLNVSDNVAVGGDITLGGGLDVGISGIYSRGTIAAFVASSTQTNPVAATFIGGNVGVGTSSPFSRLSVVGNGFFSGTLSASNITATGTLSVLTSASLASTTLTGNSLLSNATTSTFAITGISSGNILKTTTGGAVIAAVAGTDYITGAGLAAAFPFTPTTNFGVNTSATTTPLFAQAGLFASSTSQFDAANFWNGAVVGASTTPYALFGIQAASSSATTTLFAIASTSNNGAVSTLFTITNIGRVGIGSTSPQAQVGIVGADSQVAATNAPVAFMVQGGAGNTSGVGGTINLIGGVGGSSGTGGAITLTSGAGGAANGGSGSILTLGGGFNGSGSNSSLTAGNGTNVGGAITLTAGQGGATVGGAITLTAGSSRSAGGSITLTSGSATSTGSSAGTISLIGGIASSSSNTVHGGDIILSGGAASSTNTTVNGGTVALTGGSGGTGTQTVGSGGNIWLNGGAAGAAGGSIGNTLLANVRGAVGVGGTSTPYALLTVFASSTYSGASNTLFAIASTTGTATSTLFSVSNIGSTTLFQIPSSILKTDGNGTIVAAVAGTDYANFAYLFPSNATSTQIAFNGGATFAGATSTASFAVTGSTTISSVLNVGGQLNANLSAVLASTTLTGNSLFANATTSTFAVTGITSGSILKTTTGGAIVAAVAGTDYVTGAGLAAAFPFTPTTFGSTAANSTSTLIGFTNGLYALASSTIGDGTFGLTISGSATTTGTAYFAGNVGIGTSTPFAKLSVSGGDLRIKEVVDSATAFVVENAAGTSTLQISTQDSSQNIFEVASSTGTALLDVTAAGEVGIGSSTPFATLAVTNASSSTKLFGFVVASTTNSGSVSTLFSISNTGLISGLNFSLTNGTTTGSLAVTASSTVGGVLNVGGQLNANLSAVLASTTLTGNSLFTNATSTSFAITGISSGNILKTTTGGAIVAAVAGVDYAAGNVAFEFTPTTNFGINTSATTTPLFAQAGLFASSTSQFDSANFWNGAVVGASTTPYALFGIQAASSSATTTLFAIASTSNDGSVSNLFTINNIGRVGIGTTSPQAMLGITGADATVTNAAAPNALLVQGGTGNGTGAGGAISITGGLGGAGNGAGGAISLAAGTASNGTGATGSILTLSGPSNTAGGSFSVFAGDGRLAGGSINFLAGTTTTAGNAGGISFLGGIASSSTANAHGGELTFTGGAASSTVSTVSGGNVTITGGSGGKGTQTVGSGGNVLINGGTAGVAGGSLGNVLLANARAAVGVGGTTSPYALLSVFASSTNTINTLFAIGSTTGTATTTLFAVDNVGQISGLNLNLTGGATTTALAVTGSTTISSVLNVGGALNANLSAVLASTTLSGNTLLTNATTTNFFASVASSTSLFATNATSTHLAATAESAGCAQFLAGGALVSTGSACGSGGGSFSWTPTTSFGSTANSTSTLILLTNGLSASSTVRFGNAGIGGQFVWDSSLGSLGLGTSTPFAALQIATTTGKQLVLSDSGAGANLKHWLLSSLGGVFSIGTTTDLFGTSTTAAFTITSNGNVGLGTSTPFAKLSIGAQVGETNRTLFAIGSSTASATSTLFSVSNTGKITQTLGTGETIWNSFISATDVNVGTITSGGSAGGTKFMGWRNASNGAALLYYGLVSADDGSEVAGSIFNTAQSSSITGTLANVTNTNIATFCNNTPGGALANTTQCKLTIGPTGTVAVGGAYASLTNTTASPADSLIVQGNTGVGTSTPFAKLAVALNSTPTGRNAFLIASTTTGAATSTLFVVDNTGIASTTGLIVSAAGGAAGCATFSSTGQISNTGSACGGSSSFPYTPTTNFGAAANSTTTPIWFKTALQASSTSQFDAANFANGISVASTSPFAVFSLHAPAGSATTTLFAIGSTTAAGVNSTLFSISNTGSTTLALASTTNAGFEILNPGTTTPLLQGHCLTTTQCDSGLDIQSGVLAGTVQITAKSSNSSAASIVLQARGNTNAQLVLGTNGTTLGFSSTAGVFSFGPANATFGYTGSRTTNAFLVQNPGGSALTTGTEQAVWQFNGAGNTAATNDVHANGAIALQRDFLIRPSRPAFSTFSLTNVITDAATFGVDAPPQMLTANKGLITNAYGILIGSSTVNTLTMASTTNSYGLGVFAASGATNNYAATFMRGNVGVGTTSPWANFSIQANPTDAVINTTLFAIGSSTASATTTLFSISNTGIVGIGTSTATLGTTTALVVQSLSTASGAPVAAFTNVSGTCFVSPTNAGVSCSSDIRLKHNINSLGSSTNALSDVMALAPVTYNWNSEATGTPVHTGFIAQEVEQILPDLVQTDPYGMKSVNYAGFTPYLVSAVQELNLDLQALSSASASSTPQTQAFVSGFFNRMTSWLASAGNGIVDLFATHLHAETVYAKELCLGETCINESQLKALLNGQAAGASAPSSSIGNTGSTTTDTEAPTITLNGNNPASVEVGASYSDLGATITDNVDTNLGYTVSLDNATSTSIDQLLLDTSVGGTHYLVFTAADQAGNTAHATRTVIVGNGDTATSTTP